MKLLSYTFSIQDQATNANFEWLPLSASNDNF